MIGPYTLFAYEVSLPNLQKEGASRYVAVDLITGSVFPNRCHSERDDPEQLYDWFQTFDEDKR